jgi:hypothetical protein
MPCEEYKPALIEAAIKGCEPTPAIRAHVESCANCAAELVQQRSLIAAIDSNLHRQMNAPVPASMLHRLEAHLAQQTPRRSFNLSWLYAIAAFATAVAMIFVALSHPRTYKPNSQTALVQTTQSMTEPAPQIVPLVLKPATPEEIERDRRQHSHRAARSAPEVIVPPDERLGLEQFIANLNGRADLPAVIVKPLQEQPEQAVASVKTPDIQTAALVVQPLQVSNTE